MKSAKMFEIARKHFPRFRGAGQESNIVPRMSNFSSIGANSPKMCEYMKAPPFENT